MADTFAQARVKTFMRHTYTWRKLLRIGQPLPPDLLNGTERGILISGAFSGNDDEADVREAWGVPDPQYGPPIDKPCIFHDRGAEIHDAQGVTILAEPQMRVPWDDPIDDADIVMQIRDPAGNVLVAGPLRVEAGLNYAPHGVLLWKVMPLVVTTVED